jgi:hypothetical protein
MFKTIATIVAVVLSSACTFESGSFDDQGTDTSTQRLELVNDENGSALYYDTQLETLCRFQELKGETYCVPVRASHMGFVGCRGYMYLLTTAETFGYPLRAVSYLHDNGLLFVYTQEEMSAPQGLEISTVGEACADPADVGVRLGAFIVGSAGRQVHPTELARAE